MPKAKTGAFYLVQLQKNQFHLNLNFVWIFFPKKARINNHKPQATSRKLPDIARTDVAQHANLRIWLTAESTLSPLQIFPDARQPVTQPKQIMLRGRICLDSLHALQPCLPRCHFRIPVLSHLDKAVKSIQVKSSQVKVHWESRGLE